MNPSGSDPLSAAIALILVPDKCQLSGFEFQSIHTQSTTTVVLIIVSELHNEKHYQKNNI